MPKSMVDVSAEMSAGRPIPDHPDALLFTAEAAFLLGVSPRTLECWRLRGGGPPYVCVTPKAVRYSRVRLEDFVAARIKRSTKDPGPALCSVAGA